VTRKRRMEETFKVHLLREDGTRKLYQSRLQKYLDERPMTKNINTEWEEIKKHHNTNSKRGTGSGN
jgi:hypothetical protein